MMPGIDKTALTKEGIQEISTPYSSNTMNKDIYFIKIFILMDRIKHKTPLFGNKSGKVKKC